MSKRQAHVALYEKAYGSLSRSPDQRVEDLKSEIVAGHYSHHKTATPNDLDEIAGEAGWGQQVSPELLLGKFLYPGPRANHFARLDLPTVEEKLDSLAAIEALCLIRFEYLDLRNIEKTLVRHEQGIDAALQSPERLALAVSLQRYLLTIVAAVDLHKLLERYTFLGLPALTYAWTHRTSQVPIEEVALRCKALIASRKAGSYVAAALDAAALRRLCHQTDQAGISFGRAGGR